MTTETKHTPTPWLNKGNSIFTISGITAIAEVHSELQNLSNAPTQEEARANAAFIVRACNVHEELVTALNASIPALTNAWWAFIDTEIHEPENKDYARRKPESFVKQWPLAAHLVNARKALAKAKGNSNA